MLEAMIGVVIGCLYVIIDTQTIIHKTENGIFDVYRDAKMLFVDFVKIFIHILKILSENKKEKKGKKVPRITLDVLEIEKKYMIL